MEFLLLEASEAEGLRQHEGLVGLNFTMNLWNEAEDETAEEEQHRQANNAIG